MSRQPRKHPQTKTLRANEMDNQDNVLHFNKHKRKTADNNLSIKKIQPLTKNQEVLFESYNKNQHVVGIGSAGTGKSFLSLYLMLNDILNHKQYDKIKILRNCVPSRQQGFLPGNEKEKMKVYETPYMDMVGDLFGRSDAYEVLKKKDVIEFVSTSYIRGTTWNDTLVIVDEFQNMDFGELVSIITRVGTNSRIAFLGDCEQNDLYRYAKDTSGFVPFLQILNMMPSFDIIEFTIDDIVRSSLVKEFLLTKHNLNR
jgi:phosphate starvation-inducible protein PhoH